MAPEPSGPSAVCTSSAANRLLIISPLKHVTNTRVVVFPVEWDCDLADDQQVKSTSLFSFDIYIHLRAGEREDKVANAVTEMGKMANYYHLDFFKLYYDARYTL